MSTDENIKIANKLLALIEQLCKFNPFIKWNVLET